MLSRLSLRIVLFSLATLTLCAPAFGLNVVNTSAPAVNCVFSPTCSVGVIDHGADFAVSGGSGNGRLQSRIFQGQAGSPAAGKYVYEYRIIMTNVAGFTYIPYANRFAVYQWGPVKQYDYNGDAIATDHVFNVTSGGLGSKAVTAAYVTGSFTYFDLSNPVYAGSYVGGGESSYFFGLVSDYPPVLRTVWVHLDSGWVSMQGYAPQLP